MNDPTPTFRGEGVREERKWAICGECEFWDYGFSFPDEETERWCHEAEAWVDMYGDVGTAFQPREEE